MPQSAFSTAKAAINDKEVETTAFFFLFKKGSHQWLTEQQTKGSRKRKRIALSSALNTSYHFLSAVNTKLPPGLLMCFLEWWKSISIHRSHTICGLSADIPMLWRNPAQSCHYHNKDSSQHLKQVWFIWRDTGRVEALGSVFTSPKWLMRVPIGLLNMDGWISPLCEGFEF